MGYSQGGFLAYHSAMATSTLFAAVNVSGAGKSSSAPLAGNAQRKIPVDLLIGANDGLLSIARDTHA